MATPGKEETFTDPRRTIVERRKEYRLNIKMPISISGLDCHTLQSFKVDTVTCNVARLGACFELAKGLVRIGSLLDLSTGKTFEAKCRVVWIKESLHEMDALGVEFVSATGQWVLYN
jgi:hypothetical protein